MASRHEALLLREHQVFDRLVHQALVHGPDLAAVLGGLDVIGVVARQVGELLALLGARHQILGLLLGNRDLFRRLAFGGDHDLAEEDLRILAHEFRLVLFVVLLHLGFGHDHVAHDFLADDALGQHLVLHLQLEVFVSHAGVFADEGLKLVGVGDLLLHLDFGEAAGYFRIHVDVEVLALLHEQKCIDLVAQRVGGVFVDRLLKAGAGETLPLGLGFDIEPLPGKFAAGDDVAVDFGGDLFDDFDVVVCRGTNRDGWTKR